MLTFAVWFINYFIFNGVIESSRAPLICCFVAFVFEGNIQFVVRCNGSLVFYRSTLTVWLVGHEFRYFLF